MDGWRICSVSSRTRCRAQKGGPRVHFCREDTRTEHDLCNLTPRSGSFKFSLLDFGHESLHICMVVKFNHGHGERGLGIVCGYESPRPGETPAHYDEAGRLVSFGGPRHPDDRHADQSLQFLTCLDEPQWERWVFWTFAGRTFQLKVVVVCRKCWAIFWDSKNCQNCEVGDI